MKEVSDLNTDAVSIFLAGIRPDNWNKLLDSVRAATERAFELIFVGPYPPESSILKNPNVKFIQDFGSSTRCYQIGLIQAKYDFVTWSADDGYFLPNRSIDKAFELLKEKNVGMKEIISFKYYEGNFADERTTDSFWRLGAHPPLRAKYASPDYYLLMNGLLRREYLLELGGWDCSFESHGIATCDLAVRVQNDGARVTLLNEPFMYVSHFPETSGDHAPVHYAHIEHDEPYFRSLYDGKDSIGRTRIDIDNWQSAPSIWKRRFS